MNCTLGPVAVAATVTFTKIMAASESNIQLPPIPVPRAVSPCRSVKNLFLLTKPQPLTRSAPGFTMWTVRAETPTSTLITVASPFTARETQWTPASHSAKICAPTSKTVTTYCVAITPSRAASVTEEMIPRLGDRSPHKYRAPRPPNVTKR